jgi:hypothetical protein
MVGAIGVAIMVATASASVSPACATFATIALKGTALR